MPSPAPLLRRTLLPLLLVLSACDAQEPESTCSTNGNTVTATIDGLAFTARCILAARTDDGVGFTADDRSAVSNVFPHRQLALDFPGTVGTYRLGGQASALAYLSLVPPTGSPTTVPADSGSVVVQSVDGRRYRGRFAFRARNGQSVGQGVFDVTLAGK